MSEVPPFRDSAVTHLFSDWPVYVSHPVKTLDTVLNWHCYKSLEMAEELSPIHVLVLPQLPNGKMFALRVADPH